MLKQIAWGMVLLANLSTTAVWADEALNKALLSAANDKDGAKVMALVSRGADVNAKYEDGATLLHNAVSRSDKEFAEFLLTNGANVNAKDKHGKTPLHDAAGFGSLEIVQLLISKGADVNASKDDGDTPLHAAAVRSAANGGKKEFAELLISRGANVNARDRYDNTPLHQAAAWGTKDVVELLIARGADLNAKSMYDVGTPLDAATREKRNEVVVLLQAAMQKQDEMAALLQPAVQKKSGNQHEAFDRVMTSYKDRVMSDNIRRPFIALATRLKPAPVVPEEGRKFLVRGNALLQDAKNPGEARAAISEYQNALLAAPWWGDAYYNLSKAQELAGDLDGAISSMQYYLLTEPQDKRDAQDRLYALEAKRDKAKGK